MRLITWISVLGVLSAATFLLSDGVSAEGERTVEEFKAYLAEKVPALSEAQLDAIAARVDEDGDGHVSNREFAERRAAIRAVLAGEDARPDGERKAGPQRESKASDYLSDSPLAFPDLCTSETIPLLIITNDEIAEAWLPFAKWKTRAGKVARLITVQRIATEYEAEGVQEKIRLCVRDHIDSYGTRWVLLGGDCLPGCSGLVPGGPTTFHAREPKGIPTDIVYLSPTDWDADGDGRHGEWEEDVGAISYPDGSIGLGRVPVRTAEDVAAFTEKVIAYESAYPTGTFATSMIYTCTERMAYPKVRKSWDAYLSKAWRGGKMGRFFADETPWDEEGESGSHALSAENLVDLINGCKTGKLHIHGHGYLTEWVLEDSSFVRAHVAKLKNANAYPLLTTVSCFTGQYDAPQDPSIVEAMIRKPRGGSVAALAPVRTGKPHFHKPSDMRLMVTEGKLDGTTLVMTRYWTGGLGRGLTTGEAAMAALGSLAEDAAESPGFHLCLCELNLLGDPTLDMLAKEPGTPTIEVPASVGNGAQTLEVTTDAPGATLCIWKGTEVYTVVETDAEGDAKVAVAPTSPGTLLVTISGRNLNTVTTSIEVR